MKQPEVAQKAVAMTELSVSASSSVVIREPWSAPVIHRHPVVGVTESGMMGTGDTTATGS
jgi:hypothetical protein